MITINYNIVLMSLDKVKMAVSLAGLTEEQGYESMEHFMKRLKEIATSIDEAYYYPVTNNSFEIWNGEKMQPNDEFVNDKIDEAMRVLMGAKIFNEEVGF